MGLQEKTSKVTSHYNNSRKDIFLDGKHYKCNRVVTERDKILMYTKYFQCAMVFDQADGSKWKLVGETAKKKQRLH